MLAMVVSSFPTGLGGTFYAFYLSSLQPNTLFGIPLSVEIIIRPIVGGAGTLLGPIVGSFILTPLAEISRLYLGQGGLHGAHLIVYGLLLIGVVLFLLEGATRPSARAGATRGRRAMSLLAARGLSRRFGGLQAVAGLDLTVARGRCSVSSAQRRRQDHGLQSPLGFSPRMPARSSSTAARSSGCRRTPSVGSPVWRERFRSSGRSRA
jgi:hypothetical protein